MSPSRPAELAQLIARPFAHRGLHGAGRPENSRSAFLAAIDAGHGIELDVQSSAEGEAMVFHDDSLDRLTDSTGPVRSRASGELQQIRLRGSDETIPTLKEVLELVDGQAALLIEVKATRWRASAFARSIQSDLERYRGAVAVMSFNPAVPHFLARHAPGRLRGLVVTESGEPKRGRLRRRLALAWAKPDFLAYDIGDLPSAFALEQQRQGLPLLAWTCRSEAQRTSGAAHADQIIFENER